MSNQLLFLSSGSSYVRTDPSISVDGNRAAAADINGDGKPDGFNPAWQCWNLRGGYQHKSGLTANLAIENLLDLHYRYFASGMSASRRSVNLSVAYQF
jgi:outer membrane receptor protein involved in Fe transport